MSEQQQKTFNRLAVRFWDLQFYFPEKNEARKRYFLSEIRKTEKEMFDSSDAENLHLEEALEERIN